MTFQQLLHTIPSRRVGGMQQQQQVGQVDLSTNHSKADIRAHLQQVQGMVVMMILAWRMACGSKEQGPWTCVS
jgi:hypothetical protein